LALFGDDNLRFALEVGGNLLFLQFKVILGAVEEDYKVGVLLYLSALALIGQLGTFVAAVFNLTRKLGEGYDGYVQLFGQRL